MPHAQSYSQRLSDHLGDSDPTGLILFAIGGTGVVFGVGFLIGQILFTQQISPAVWKIVIGAVGAGLPIGVSGGILLIKSDPQLIYIGGGLLSSLGALLLFEIAYPEGWEPRYSQVGTVVYVSGVIVLLGLAAWVMRDWFEGDVDSTETGTGSIEANDEEAVDGDAEPASTGEEPVEFDSEKDSNTDSSREGKVDTTSQTKYHGDQPIPLEVRVKNVNEEVSQLKIQLNRPDVSETSPELDALESRVEEEINRINEMMPEIASLVDQTRALEKNLDEIRLEFDRKGSETARAVERVQRKLPGFRDDNTRRERDPVTGSAPAPRRHSVPGDRRDQGSAQRPAGEQPKRQTRSASDTQRRTNSVPRRSNQSRGTAFTRRQAIPERNRAERVDYNHLTKVFIIAALAVSAILAISYLI